MSLDTVCGRHDMWYDVTCPYCRAEFMAAGSKALLEAATWFRGYSGAIAAEDVACALEALADGAPAKWVRKD